MKAVELPNYETLRVCLEDHVAWVALNRPDKANAINEAMWREFQHCFEWLDEEPAVRVVVLCGEGKNFCAGIDLSLFSSLIPAADDDRDPARRAEQFRRTVLELQNNISAIERCRKPVIAAIHGNCIGGGVDLVSACDMRYCSGGARFSIKEIDLGIVADVGTLQRLPKLIPDGLCRELAYTGRVFEPDEAVRIGFCNQRFDSYQEMVEGVDAIARDIARKAPLAVRGCKQVMLYARDHSVADALQQVALWNAAMISEQDIRAAMSAAVNRDVGDFDD